MPSKSREAEKKVRVKRRPQKTLKKIIILLMVVYFISIIYGFANDVIVTYMAGVGKLQEGVINSFIEAGGIVVRDEVIVPSPSNGTLKVMIPEGERVKFGEVVAQVITASLKNKSGQAAVDIKAPTAGVVSYHLDGLEEVYSRENIKKLDLSAVGDIKIESRKLSAGEAVEKGRPVLKIFNNLEPVFIIAEPKGKNFNINTLNDQLRFAFKDDAEGTEYYAVLEEKQFRGSRKHLLLRIDNGDKRFITPRKVEIQIITQRYEGYVIPEKAIVKKDKKEGVYIVYKERVRWVEVKVKGRAQGKAVISGITPDKKVISNPEHVKEGQALKFLW